MDNPDIPSTSRIRTSQRQRAITGEPKKKKQKQSHKKKKKKSPTNDLVGAAWDVGQDMPTTPLELPAPYYCDKCYAKKFAYEPPKFCCSGGECSVVYNQLPDELVRLYTAKDPDAAHFQTYARLYNNVFAFSSLGGGIESYTHRGIYTFKLHGQLYHYVPDLLPDGSRPQYLQLYFYDAQHEAENRMGLFPELRPDVVAILMQVMQRNPYAQFFKSLRELPISADTVITLNQHPGLDQRVYNAPTANEVAAIWTETSASHHQSTPHITVYGKSNESHRIMHYFGCYDPLQYPLLYPQGDCGWHHGLLKLSFGGGPQQQLAAELDLTGSVSDGAELLQQDSHSAYEGKRGRYISAREYYAYRFQIRAGNMLLRAGRLFLQYIVDMYVKIENTRLDFFRKNQKKIRAELYQGLMDTFAAGETDAGNVGRDVILPPTFLGGPRDLGKRYLNAITLVQRFGKPDLFVTMTCNPNWPEIKAELGPGETADNRPDIVARVFHAKLIALKKQIMEEKVFGEVAAFIYVVEFQKCGLPHVHMLIILKPEYKIKDPAAFDRFTCAELPSHANPHLRKVVVGHMMHGPCGKDFPDCPCMKKKGSVGSCKYGYPRAFADTTTSYDSGYPMYRRRNTGETVAIRGKQLDNRWVIPYNPYLSALFDCHLNVEVCSTIQAVKYLYKYIYKGHDRCSFNVAEPGQRVPVNEIEQFQSGRWVSACEAAWRIFSFDLYEMIPAVMLLQVHLPNQQSVRFESNEQLSNVVSDARRSRTSLTEFFSVNAQFPNKPKLLYSEFCEHHVWQPGPKAWKDRAQRGVIGRLAFVSPSEGERYFLRLLLAYVRAPKSFEDLRTVRGYLCATFQEAAVKLGLLDEDNAIERCMDEASAVKLGLLDEGD